MSCCAGTVAPDVDECTDLIDRQLRVERLAAAKMPVALFLGIQYIAGTVPWHAE